MAVTTRKGSATRHEALGLSLDDVKGMYRYVLMTRLVSERILQLNRMGRTPFGAGTDGHEAAQIGAAWCIQRGKDWTVPYYRDMGVAFVLGFSALDEFRGVLAKATDPNSAGRAFLNMFSSPKDRLVSGSVCVGTEFPHAVGLALALKLRKEPYIVFAFGGDASTSTGDFHEAMNFAAVHKLPVVFVIENNLIAISRASSGRPRSRTSPTRPRRMRCPATSPTGWTCSIATRRRRSRPITHGRGKARASSSSSAIATNRTRATTTTAAIARRTKSTRGARKTR